MFARSLNARLLLAILASMVVALAVGGTIIHQLFKKRLFDDLDSSLRTNLSFHILACVQVDDNIEFFMSNDEWNRHMDPENPLFAQFRIAEGRQGHHVHHSPSLNEHDLEPVGIGSADPVYKNITLFNGKAARAVGMEFSPSVNDGNQPRLRLHAVVAKELTSVLASLQQLRLLMLQVAGGLTVLLLASTSIILRKNLSPLEELSAQIEATPLTGGPDAHFELKGAPAELDPVVHRLNSLMDRVDGAFERERQFTANAAHELRNPLAGIRSQIELAFNMERTPEEYRDILSGVYDIEQGMERVVENLLILARLESGEQRVEHEIVPLTEVLRRGWRKVYDAAEVKDLRVVWDIQRDLPVLKTARNLISIIVRNLLDNAVDYSPAGGDIKIAAHYDRLTSAASIRVANSNTGLSEEDCTKMFDLFWRGDKRDGGGHVHAGLGLGLCRRIVDILKGDLRVKLTEGNRTVEFHCTFPCEILALELPAAGSKG